MRHEHAAPEAGVAGDVGHRSAVVQVEVCDQHGVHLGQVHLVKEGQRGDPEEAGVHSAVQHHRLAAIAHDDAGAPHLLPRAQRQNLRREEWMRERRQGRGRVEATWVSRRRGGGSAARPPAQPGLQPMNPRRELLGPHLHYTVIWRPIRVGLAFLRECGGRWRHVGACHSRPLPAAPDVWIYEEE